MYVLLKHINRRNPKMILIMVVLVVIAVAVAVTMYDHFNSK